MALQKSHMLMSMFNQLRVGPKVKEVETMIIINIATEFESHWFTNEAYLSRGFMEMTNVITFTNEGIEFQHTNYRYVTLFCSDVKQCSH